MKKSMITIEALIALIILFLAITSLTTGVKFFQYTKKNKNIYENYYINVLSIKDKLEAQGICTSSNLIRGTLNGFEYSANCILVKDSRTYIKAFDEGEKGGNIGNFNVSLYKVKLQVLNKFYEYYLTKDEKIN